jgi:hypothetical protein
VILENYKELIGDKLKSHLDDLDKLLKKFKITKIYGIDPSETYDCIEISTNQGYWYLNIDLLYNYKISLEYSHWMFDRYYQKDRGDVLFSDEGLGLKGSNITLEEFKTLWIYKKHLFDNYISDFLEKMK